VSINHITIDHLLHWTIPEAPGGDFTLYFLAYDHGDNLSPEQKKNSRFSREGINLILLDLLQYPIFTQASLN
jgi:hypothetical protein